MSIVTEVPPARIDATDSTLSELPIECQMQANVLRTVGTELHEHHLNKHGLRDLHLAQNRDMHLLALRKLMKNEHLESCISRRSTRLRRTNYHQKKDSLFLNPDDKLCVNYVHQQRALHVRPCIIVMPQIFQHESSHRAHDE